MTDFECTPHVDLEFMNAEHRKAFVDADDIKRLLQAARADLDSIEKNIDRKLDKLLVGTISHFQKEEEVMKEFSFPARVKHRQEHQQFLRGLNAECRHWRSKHNLEAVERLEHYVGEEFPNWLVNHIVTLDTVTASYIAHHGGNQL